MNPSRNVDKK